MQLVRVLSVKHEVGSSAYRRRSARVSAQVWLWRLATVALAGGLVLAISPRITHGEPSQHDRAELWVKQLAFEAFPMWAVENHRDACPQAVTDLLPYAPHSDGRDPWGNPLELLCGPFYRGAFVRSAGPDGRFDTADDITSND
jgi:hypothetical protein